MAYQANSLSALNYANGFTLWHYRSSDSQNEIDSSGYFNGAAGLLRPGDFMLLNAGVGVVPTHGLVVVVANAGGVVDVTNTSNIGTTNTD